MDAQPVLTKGKVVPFVTKEKKPTKNKQKQTKILFGLMILVLLHP